jgi:cytochrome c2
MTRMGPLLFVCLLMAGCAPDPEVSASAVVPGGNPQRGKALILRYGCGSCHTIPGISGADGLVGPPLLKFAMRSFIAGRLQNTPDHLVAWIHNPKQIDEKTAMPNMGIPETEAVHIARYLYSLR